MSFNTIPQNLNRGISDGRTWVDDRFNALLSPNTAEGIGGFLFDVPKEEQIELLTDVTDHFTENNSFINDHVVNQPIRVTLSGFQGELVFERPRGIAGAAQQLQNRLETVEAYLGDRTPGIVQQTQDVIGQAQTAISAINQTLDRVQNVVGLLEGGFGPELTRQQQAYNQLNGFRVARTPVTLLTPWAYFNSMIITSVVFVQTEESEDISDITVSLKEFRVAETQTVAFDEDLFAPREQVQTPGAEDQGNIRGTDANASILFQGAQSTGLIP